LKRVGWTKNHPSGHLSLFEVDVRPFRAIIGQPDAQHINGRASFSANTTNRTAVGQMLQMAGGLMGVFPAPDRSGTSFLRHAFL